VEKRKATSGGLRLSRSFALPTGRGSIISPSLF
jgi:hypothetical protein